MLLGSEIAAALTALEPLGIDMIGLNCATGPGEMSEHLRYLAAHARIPISCEPNAGLPMLTSDGARYPLTPAQLADAHDRFTREFGLSLVGGCCGTTPEHTAALADRLAGRPARQPQAAPRARGGLAVPARAVPPGHRLPVHRRADQRQRVQGVPRRDARGQVRGLRADRAGPDQGRRSPARRVRGLRGPGRRRRHARGRRPVRHRGHAAAGARLDRARRDRGGPGDDRRPLGHQLGQLRGRRRARLADRADDAAGARARRRRDRADHRRARPGAHRRVEGRRRRAADRGPDRELGDAGRGHHRRLPDVPHRHRPGGDAARRDRDHRGDRRAQAPLPGRADDAGRIQRVVRPQARRPRRAELRLPGRMRASGPGLRDRARSADHADRPDTRRAAAGGPRPRVRPAAGGLRPAGPAARAVRGGRRGRAEGEPGRGAGRAAAVGAAQAADHRRGAVRARGGPGRRA